jgi:luciferase family oxidoreductase group 1
VKLSVLDQSPVPEGSTGADALRNTIDLAQLADRLGYERYWVAEHHGTPMLAGPAPEVLIGPIAAATERIRVGSGGVMLPHYSPLKVAESFSILSSLFGDRIDLGLGRAPGTDPETMLALQRDRRRAVAHDDFPEQLGELLAYLGNEFPRGHRWARLGATLPGPDRPEVWLLGSSPQSAIWAAEFGLSYAFADFIAPHNGEIARAYREAADAPRVAVAVSAICAESDEEAVALASSMKMAWALLRSGRLTPIPTVERAQRYLAENHLDGIPGRRGIVGSPDTVKAGLEAVAAEYGADEVIVVTITHDHEARRHSYQLIAEAFGISSSVTTPGVSATEP